MAALVAAIAVILAALTGCGSSGGQASTACKAGSLNGTAYSAKQSAQALELARNCVKLFAVAIHEPVPGKIVHVTKGTRQNAVQCLAHQTAIVPTDGTALFCPLQRKTYVGQLQVATFLDAVGSIGPVLLLAHETGHQWQLDRKIVTAGTESTNVALESQADCVAGAFLRYARAQRWTSLTTSSQPIKSYLTIISTLSEVQAKAHGSLKTRTTAFERGDQRGLQACNSYTSRALLPN